MTARRLPRPRSELAESPLHPRTLLLTWLDFRRSVNRRQYLVSGIALLAVKYLFDSTVLWLATGTWWPPLAYLDPRPLARFPAGGASPEALGSWAFWLIAATSLLFLALGASLTIRRCADAGLAPALGLLFVLPYLNYLLFAVLSVAATASEPAPAPEPCSPGTLEGDVVAPRWRRTLTAAGLAAALGLVGAASSIYLWRRYGVVLFVATPFAAGFVAGWALNRNDRRPVSEMVGIVSLTVAAGCLALLAFALEGLVCILMALPLIAALALLGGALGRELASLGYRRHATLALFLVLPLLPAVEAARGPNERSVASELIVDAAPEEVWRHVVAFPELPPPHRLLFRLGIAAPEAASISEAGVGGVRTCDFTTGAFIEPITVWDPPHRLAFDVSAQPSPLRELSPYPAVLAPHLDFGFEVLRGEFLLLPAGDGTRLVGTTWYRLHLQPEVYWSFWSDRIVGAIHARVLEHIASLAGSSRFAPSLPASRKPAEGSSRSRRRAVHRTAIAASCVALANLAPAAAPGRAIAGAPWPPPPRGSSAAPTSPALRGGAR